MVAVASLCAAVVGCAAPGRIQLTSLNFREIDPPAPAFSTVELDYCGWWTDDDGKLWIAMERVQRVPLVPDALVFRMSLALDDPPAGAARNYSVSRKELRAFARFGPAQSRFMSLAGIAALYREPNARFRGSMRLDVAQQTQQLLGQWSGAQRQLMLIEFVAQPDDGRGRRIAEESEAVGLPRRPAATAPSTAPSSPPQGP